MLGWALRNTAMKNVTGVGHGAALRKPKSDLDYISAKFALVVISDFEDTLN